MFSITSDAANAIAAAPTTRIVAAPAALVSGAGRVPASGRCLISTRASSRAVWDRGVLIRSLLALIGCVLPPSRMPAAGTSAPEPDPTWPLAQPSSCTFGGYTEHAGASSGRGLKPRHEAHARAGDWSRREVLLQRPADGAAVIAEGWSEPRRSSPLHGIRSPRRRSIQLQGGRWFERAPAGHRSQAAI